MQSFRLLLLLPVVWAAASYSISAEDASGAEAASGPEQMLRRHLMYVMRMRPVQATRYGLADEDVGARVNDAMDNFSLAHMREWRRTIRGMRMELRALDDGKLDALTLAALDEIYGVYLGESEIPFGFIDTAGRHRPYVINQIDQPLQEVPKVMTTFQQASTPEEAADYLRRLWAFQSLVHSVLGKFNADADAGWIPPRPLLDGALEFIEGFTKPPATEHELVTVLMKQVEASDAFSEDQRARIRNEAIAVMLSVVYPSYRNAAKAVRARLSEARRESGVWAQPLGERFYAHSVRHEARTDKSPEEIHRLGLAEVDRLRAEMDVKLIAQGYQKGSVGERMRQLAIEERFLYTDTAAGRGKLLADLNAVADAMQARLPEYFGRLPAQGVEIRPIPESRQAGAPGGQYDGPPADGSRPGIFWINLRDMNDLPWFRLSTLTYHETVPGHHLQVALARSQAGRPLLWRFANNNAYSEGWALYAERLAAEIGVYDADPVSDLGRLQAELFRAVRLVVDTGMHHKRWSREQAIDYMRQVTGRGEVDVTAEIERYMAWPGQALSYKLGMLEILDMRTGAAASLGDSFDLKGFHDTVLETGPVSMPLLRKQVQTWVERH